MTLEALGVWQLVFVAAAILLAGFVHGALGFGFPLIATPIVALVLDIKLAIVLIAPVTLVVTVISVARGGGWREAIRGFWYLPLAMALWLAAAVLAIPSVGALYSGMRVRGRIDAPTYRRWLRRALWIMATLLMGQYAYLEYVVA